GLGGLSLLGRLGLGGLGLLGLAGRGVLRGLGLAGLTAASDADEDDEDDEAGEAPLDDLLHSLLLASCWSSRVARPCPPLEEWRRARRWTRIRAQPSICAALAQT